MLAVGGASAFAPQQVNARSSSSLSSTTAAPTYTFTKSEEIFTEALEVGCYFYFVGFIICLRAHEDEVSTRVIYFVLDIYRRKYFFKTALISVVSVVKYSQTAHAGWCLVPRPCLQISRR